MFGLTVLAAGFDAALAQTPAGTVIRNVASVRFSGAGGQPAIVHTNEANLTVLPRPSRAALQLFRAAEVANANAAAVRASWAVTQCQGTNGSTVLAPPALPSGATIDPQLPLTLVATTVVHGGEALFLLLQDADQNLDASVIDTADVTVTSASGDVERLQLLETDPDSGEFAGYIQTRAAAPGSGDCELQVERNSSLESIYVDRSDSADTARAGALVDPFGIVFAAHTGAPVDGVRVRLVRANGAPAQVFGDDGVSSYPAEIVTGQPVTDSGGTVYQYAAGVFRFPLVAAGDYRLEVVPPPGHAFPSQASAADLQQLPGAPYALGPGSLGNTFAVTGPTPTNVDIPLDPAGSALVLQKASMTAVAAAGDFVQYTLSLRNAGTTGAYTGVAIVDRLPPGVRYRPGSTRLGELPAADPAISADGVVLTYTLDSLAAGATATLRYVVEITVAARGPELANSALARADGGAVSNGAVAVIQLREELFRTHAIVMGRVVAGDCEREARALPGVAGVRVYLEDGRYAITDADGKYHFEEVRPGTHVVQLDTVTLPQGHVALHCAARVRQAGRAHSQFIEVRGGALWRADFVVTTAGVAPVASVAPATDGASVASRPVAQARPPAPARDRATLAGTPDFTLEKLEPGSSWLWPGADFSAPIPSIKVAIAHAPDQVVELAVNTVTVSARNFDGRHVNAAGTVAVSRWGGVDLRAGENVLRAVIRAPDGRIVDDMSRTVHYAGGAVSARIDAARSTLVADGRSRPIVALRLFDAHGKPARRGTLGAWRVDAPYRTWWEVASLRDNPLVALDRREPTFEVDDEGIALLELEPTSQTGTATLRVRLNDRQSEEFRVWFEPEARDWILVGVAEGSSAHRTISGNAEVAAAAGLDADFTEEGRVAFFAKGRIKGEFLLTLAYDSARDPALARRRLLGVIEPDRYYTLYSDGADPRDEAASTEKLFVKLERRQFMALFGDFETGLTVTELTRYSRSFTGLRSDYAGEHFGYSAFAADSSLGFAKDELAGDGTSGLYRLTRAGLIVGSDKLRIEVRDRFRSEIVLESRTLSRFVDYNIDYYAGTLFFKEPVPSRDPAFNPVYIIAEYEVRGRGEEQITAGGRANVKFAGNRGELGASYIAEGAVQGDSEVYGTDLRWRPVAATELRAELAHSSSDDPARAREANAWLAELRHVTERIDARAYVAETESGFGTGQQLSTEVGTRKAGLDARILLGGAWQAIAGANAEDIPDSGAQRRHAMVEVRREAAGGRFGAGLRGVEDRGTSPGPRRSEQAFASGSIDLWDQRVTLRGAADANLAGRNESVDYPDRFVLGADYALRPDVKVFAEYEHADGADFAADMARVGVRATPWNRAQLNSGVTQQATEYGPRTFANFGLTQGWQVNNRLALDVGIDQSNTLRGAGPVPLVPGRPLASGSVSDDFLASFAGALYRTESWTTTSRIEWRAADSEDRLLLSGGLYREPVRGHEFALRTQAMSSEAATGADTTSADTQLSWALRPVASRWIVLDRLDLRYERQRDTASEAEAARIINNLNASWQLDNRTQLGLQWGLRYVRSSFDGERYDGLSDLYGADLRRDLTSRFDIGAHATAMNSWESSVHDYSLGIDVGITIARNMWISVGYNVQGFEDDDYAASRYTASGPYLKLRIKADQDTFRDLGPRHTAPPHRHETSR